jgi:AraC-like DNA-binding protein
MQYLAGWRMHLARRLLRESTLSLVEVAARVGYESEAAFNRAFNRIVGTPPGTWRQAKAAALGEQRDHLDRGPTSPNKDGQIQTSDRPPLPAAQ